MAAQRREERAPNNADLNIIPDRFREKSPYPSFPKRGLTPPEKLPLLKNGAKEDLISLSAIDIDWSLNNF
jgi:hypothetical protein